MVHVSTPKYEVIQIFFKDGFEFNFNFIDRAVRKGFNIPAPLHWEMKFIYLLIFLKCTYSNF